MLAGNGLRFGAELTTAALRRWQVQDSYREKLAEAGAIPPLKEIVDAHTTTSDEEQEEITLVALEALRNLARSHKMKEVLRVGGFTEAIIQLLKEGRDSAVSAAAVGVVRNLAVSPFNQEVLRKAGAIPLLVDFLHFGAESDVAAAAAAALGNLAIGSESNKEAIRKSGALPELVKLLQMKVRSNSASNGYQTPAHAHAHAHAHTHTQMQMPHSITAPSLQARSPDPPPASKPDPQILPQPPSQIPRASPSRQACFIQKLAHRGAGGA